VQRTETDHEHLTRAIDLAERGVGSVSPNPVVGAVVVKDDRVLGEGWHEEYGGPHAEVNAIASAGDADLQGATLYVSLEPCCHRGQQPPCTDAILAAGIGRVVVASDDPTEKASGRGLGILRDEGVQVDLAGGELAARARQQNQAFRKHARTGRPWVLFKSAMSLDGKVATKDGRLEVDLQRGQPARRPPLARLVRRGGRRHRHGPGRRSAADRPDRRRRHQPRRVVFDATGRLPLDSKLVSAAHEVPLVVVVSRAARRSNTGRAGERRRGGRRRHRRERARPRALGARPARRAGPARDLGAARGRPAPGRAPSSTAARSTSCASSSPRCCSGGRSARDPLEGEGVDAISDALRALTLECEKVAGDVLLSARLREW
jgi:diaminohydroxyphosphoribosylaminopyrimidine deaminase/5-amino-6-(5-phosphoribosylamino)uracil reductase